MSIMLFSTMYSTVPSSAVITDVTGSTTTLAPELDLILPAENIPRFTEVVFP